MLLWTEERTKQRNHVFLADDPDKWEDDEEGGRVSSHSSYTRKTPSLHNTTDVQYRSLLYMHE